MIYHLFSDKHFMINSIYFLKLEIGWVLKQKAAIQLSMSSFMY